MKRSGFLKRTPLRGRVKPLNRDLRKRPRSAKISKYRNRDRDVDFMIWVKTLPCATWFGILMPWLPPDVPITPCDGVIEADHMGERGLGQKADDTTCCPLCTRHHRERTDHNGSFRLATKEQMREWRSAVLLEVLRRRTIYESDNLA